MQLINALTVDVEDYYQVSNFERAVSRRDWDNYPSRVVESTRRILALMAQANVQGTFFVLGYTAERHPELVREIAAGGHELASHSYWHRLVYQLTPAEFREDLRRSKGVIEAHSQAPVTAYRAPSFSITRKSAWALEILGEEGFTVDSSIFPVRHTRYGIPSAPRQPHRVELAQGSLVEFPISVSRLWGRVNFPVAGGGYFRLFPWQMTRRLLRSIHQQAGKPFVFYIHPWEFDPEQPKIKGGTRMQRFRHYVNLKHTSDKFRKLLATFSFGTLGNVLYSLADQLPPISAQAYQA